MAEGNDQPGGDHRNHHQDGTEREQQTVGARRDDVFLDQQFEAVSQGLKNAEGTGIFRTNALLNRSGDFALKPDRDQNANHRSHQHQQHRQREPEQPCSLSGEAQPLQRLAET